MQRLKHSLFPFLWILVLVFPIFISLDFSKGLNFSADPYNHPGKPSLPTSYLVVIFLFFRGIKRIAHSFEAIFFMLLSSIAVLEIFHGLTRQIFTLFGMFVPIALVIILRKEWEGNADSFFSKFRLSIYIMVFVKFATDMFFGRTFSSNSFIFENIIIYNYYDYYPVFYSLIACLCTHSILKKEKIITSSIILIVCILFIINSHSRLAMVLILLIPFNIILSKIHMTRNLFFGYSCLLFTINILLTILIPLLLKDIDQSMAVRFDHWRYYWEGFSFISIIIRGLSL